MLTEVECNEMYETWWTRRSPGEKTAVVLICNVLSLMIVLLDPTWSG